MASAQQIAPHEGATPTAGAPTWRSYARYLLFATLIPLLLWCAAFPIVTSKSYEDWGETEYGPVLEYPFMAGTPDADVVVFGDSSAFLGMNPRLVNQQLGLTSVVLPSTVGSLPVIGDTPLRSYLAHHKRPRLIVLYFSAWNLDFSHAAPGRHFEGEEMMLRHGSAGELLRYGLLHPIELIAFPIRLYSTFGSHMLLNVLHHQSREQDTFRSLGHSPFNEPYPPLEDLCRIPSTYLKQYGDDTVQGYRHKYEAMGYPVMVYLAPIPNCTNSGAVHDRSFAAVGAATPALLPPTDFAGDPYYAHVLPPFVPLSSRIFADTLAQQLQHVAPDLLHPAARTIPPSRQASGTITGVP